MLPISRGERVLSIQHVPPITAQERKERLETARQLMVNAGMEAICVGAGASLRCFTGVEWSPSERLLGAV